MDEGELDRLQSRAGDEPGDVLSELPRIVAAAGSDTGVAKLKAIRLCVHLAREYPEEVASAAGELREGGGDDSGVPDDAILTVKRLAERDLDVAVNQADMLTAYLDRETEPDDRARAVAMDALDELAQLAPEAVASSLPSVVAGLYDPDDDVKRLAVWTCSRLPAEELSHSTLQRIAELLTYEGDDQLREVASRTLADVAEVRPAALQSVVETTYPNAVGDDGEGDAVLDQVGGSSATETSGSGEGGRRRRADADGGSILHKLDAFLYNNYHLFTIMGVFGAMSLYLSRLSESAKVVGDLVVNFGILSSLLLFLFVGIVINFSMISEFEALSWTNIFFVGTHKSPYLLIIVPFNILFISVLLLIANFPQASRFFIVFAGFMVGVALYGLVLVFVSVRTIKKRLMPDVVKTRLGETVARMVSHVTLNVVYITVTVAVVFEFEPLSFYEGVPPGQLVINSVLFGWLVQALAHLFPLSVILAAHAVGLIDANE